MPTDGIIVKIGGEDHAIFTTVCGGTRAPTGYRTGRKKGFHGVGELFRMGVLARGGVPSTVRSDGAQNFASAQSEMRKNDEGKKSMHVRRISSRRQESEQKGARQQDDPALCALVQGAQECGAACIALNRIHILVACPRSVVGTTPWRPREYRSGTLTSSAP